MRLSVIVATYNRKDELRELLDSLEEQTLRKEEFEVVVVDDGSTDGTVDWLEGHRKNSSLTIRLFRQENSGPAAARNRGMQEASGEYFIFIDSDCTASPHWLETISQSVETEKLGAFGGPDEAHESFPPLLKAINYTMTSFLTTGGLRGRSGMRLAKYYPRSFNMGLRKEVWQRIGGFGNLRFGEDIEFSNRILKSGARVAFLPDAIVYHRRRTTLKKFFKQVFNSGVTRVILYKIDPKTLEPLHMLPGLFVLFVLAATLFAVLDEDGLRFWTVAAITYVGVMLLAAILAVIRSKDVRVGFLVAVVFTVQTAGYGLGFLSGILHILFLKHDAYTGFTKKYYH